MKKIIQLLIVISILSNGCVQNKNNTNNTEKMQMEQSYTIDKIEGICISKNCSTQGMLECTYKAKIAWENEINTNLTLLKNITSKEDFKNIQLSQKYWESYRDKENLLYDLIQQKQGTMFQNVVAGHKRDLSKQRALELKSIYDNLKY